MSEREDVEALDAVDFVKRLVVAWDCCGTCAGGVLAVHDELVRADERERLAGEFAAIEAPLGTLWKDAVVKRLASGVRLTEEE